MHVSEFTYSVRLDSFKYKAKQTCSGKREQIGNLINRTKPDVVDISRMNSHPSRAFNLENQSPVRSIQ